jgi:hypothetical protein
MPHKRTKTTKVRRVVKNQHPVPLPAQFLMTNFSPTWELGPAELVTKRKVGRRTVPENLLWGRCADIAYAFEVDWPKIGWQLQCLRNRADASPDEVRNALQPLRDQNGRERLSLLLRPTSIPATSNDVRRALGAVVEARKKSPRLEELYSAKLERFAQARRAVYEASQKHRQQLKEEITRRIGNRGQLKAERDAKERSLAAAQRKLNEANPNQREAANVELSKSQADFEKCKESLRVEENIISGLKESLALATKANWSLARKEKRKCVRQLKELKAERKRQSIEADRLDTLYRDQAAGFSRQDFLRFLSQKRAHHNPRQLAKAVAGLPEMGCRESFAKNRNHLFPSEYHLNCRVFEVIDRAWSKRDRHNSRLGDLLQREISRLPKTKVVNGKRVPNYLRQFLHEKRADLDWVIEHCVKVIPRPHPGEMPYIVTAKFLENLSRPRTSLERVLSAHGEGEQEVPPNDC